MAHCLVTGGAGFIGSHVVRELQRRDHTVTVLDDLSGGFEDNVPGDVRLVSASITDARAVRELFSEERFQHVYHLAAYAAEGLSHFIRAYNYSNNVVGSMNVINECIRSDVECLVFTSSIAVYGANQLPMREDLTPAPEDPYGIAKFAVEQDLRAAHEMFGLRSVVFRPHNVYGEYQNIGDKYRNVIGIFMNRLMQGQSMPIFGDGSQTRAFSYVGDIAPVMVDAPTVPESWGEVFNVGADRDYSVRDLAETVARAMGVEPRIELLEERKEVKHAYSDHSKVKRVFGERPETSLEDGLAAMAEWARSVGPRASQPFENIEVTRNLPPAWLR